MADKTKETYFATKDEHGTDYLCPTDKIKNHKAVSDKEFEECVEEDVVRRYSGNIKVQDDFAI